MLPALVVVAAQTFCGFPFPLFSLDLQNYLHEMFGFLFYLKKRLFFLTVFDCRVEFQSRTVQAQNLDKSFLEVFWKTPLSQTVSAL